MADDQPGSLSNAHSGSETKAPSEGGQEDALSLQRTVFESPGSRDSIKSQDLEDAELGYEVQEEEALPEEEVNAEEFLDDQSPEEAASGQELDLDKDLDKDTEEAVPEMSRLSISPGVPSISKPRCRRRRRIYDLAKPKINWQVLKNRACSSVSTGRPCTGQRSSSRTPPSRSQCQLSPAEWRSWLDRRGSTWNITTTTGKGRAAISGQPGGKLLFPDSRTTPIWPIPRCTLEHQASGRLRELATPRIRNNIWSINMTEVSQVSRAAQMAVPSPRILCLAKPRVPATLLEEWNPMPKPKPHASDYNRLLQLAGCSPREENRSQRGCCADAVAWGTLGGRCVGQQGRSPEGCGGRSLADRTPPRGQPYLGVQHHIAPKTQSDKCIPDRDPRWKVLEVTKKAVASPRIISLAQPKVRKDLNEGYDPYHVSPASLVARASPRLFELATPKSITKKM
ncbi:testicular haploid expressed gene protein isoform X1 [Talpa occidentalis]|uniref:testicular haploid expressed gene protein isoform X1 n=1 Tax=Talpa occidentalis TaxID=50954 RepID=UPI00188FB494|nr:testicular haploid expressed gene protein isoform X1 [Talpa occidentalis]